MPEMELLDYLKMLRHEAERMNAKFVSVSMSNCQNLGGWNYSITLSEDSLDASSESVDNES